MTQYLRCAETAKLLRAALSESFPGIKFGVRSKTYSGGASIDVSWTDGPTAKQATAVVHRFEGSYFDGMTDYKGNRYHTLDGKPVSFAADFIFCRRDLTDQTIANALAIVTEKFHMTTIYTVEQYRRGDLSRPAVLSNVPDFDAHWCVATQVRVALEDAESGLGMEPAQSATLARIVFTGDDGYSRSMGTMA